jgi:hypothetical protein
MGNDSSRAHFRTPSWKKGEKIMVVKRDLNPFGYGDGQVQLSDIN